MRSKKIVSFALALLLVVSALAVPAWSAERKLPETISYKRTGDGKSSVTSTVVWDLENGLVSVYEQPYNKEAAPWILAFLATEPVSDSSALTARLGYDGIKQNQDLALALNPLITDGAIKKLIVVDNKGYQQTADQYFYTFKVDSGRLTRVDCSKVEADMYGTNVRRTHSWVTYDYDTAGRVVGIHHSDGRSDAFVYAEDGRLESFTVDKVTYKAQYDENNQLVPVNQTNKVVYQNGENGSIVGVTSELPGVFTETYSITEYWE